MKNFLLLVMLLFIILACLSSCGSSVAGKPLTSESINSTKEIDTKIKKISKRSVDNMQKDQPREVKAISDKVESTVESVAKKVNITDSNQKSALELVSKALGTDANSFWEKSLESYSSDTDKQDVQNAMKFISEKVTSDQQSQFVDKLKKYLENSCLGLDDLISRLAKIQTEGPEKGQDGQPDEDFVKELLDGNYDDYTCDDQD